jgi:GT2 family glycosyltransferase
LKELEGDKIKFIRHDNSSNNIGFAAGCNFGAQKGSAPVIGFLNPDVEIQGCFIDKILDVFESNSNVVITGENFGKLRWEYESWGCKEWVCGAAFFVRRNWFESVGGFDRRFIWSWEESDLICQAQVMNKLVKPIELPIDHQSPTNDSEQDSEYKSLHFNRGAKLFRQKWGR